MPVPTEATRQAEGDTLPYDRRVLDKDMDRDRKDNEVEEMDGQLLQT